MRVAVVGGHGQIALRLTALLHADGHEVVSVIRNPEHAADVEAAGGGASVLDVERADAHELAGAFTDADAVVFAAGAGPGSGAERKTTMDRDGAVLSADAAELAGVRRFLIVSAIHADEPADDADEVFAAYLRAKAEADEVIRGRTELDWTVVRPGTLTNDRGTGRVRLASRLDGGSIPRDDVAAVLHELLVTGSGVGRQFEIVSGSMPVDEAVASL